MKIKPYEIGVANICAQMFICVWFWEMYFCGRSIRKQQKRKETMCYLNSRFKANKNMTHD